MRCLFASIGAPDALMSDHPHLYSWSWFDVFLRTTPVLPRVFTWADLLPADTDRCVLADRVLDGISWRGRPQSLVEREWQ